jgi:hypothetical protein
LDAERSIVGAFGIEALYRRLWRGDGHCLDAKRVV